MQYLNTGPVAALLAFLASGVAGCTLNCDLSRITHQVECNIIEAESDSSDGIFDEPGEAHGA